MSNEEILEKLKEIIVERLGVEEDLVTEKATFVDDLSADSLDIVELIMEIEEIFDLEIADSEAEKIKHSEEMNHLMWPITKEVNLDESLSFEDAIQRMKDRYEVRFSWLDNEISKM